MLTKKSNLEKQLEAEKKNKAQNQGGLLGGLGYLAGSAIAGVGGIVEGNIDAIIAPLADLTGNHAFAESLFKNNVVGDWHKSITEDYNPTGFMQFAGDVLHGMGQSAWMFVPYAGKPIFFVGVMSQGISNAAEKTGDVGVKEVAYGLTSGAVEGLLEVGLGAAAKGAKSIAVSASKSGVKTVTAKAASSAVRKGLVKQVVSDAASEFTEEALSEVIDTGLQRAYQIDPNKELSLRDVLYAGAVGAVSGSVTTSVVQVPLSAQNTARGAKIIKNGNSQTLVNTATSIADRLAAEGTNWKKAPEWVATLRGQVDAYNKLDKKGKTGLRGQTILGEMQASLFFAEHGAMFNEVQNGIQNADEQKRATWAEYINKTIPSERRRGREFTAADIAKNTDNIAWQLAIYKYVPAMFDIDGAVADIEQEQAISDFVAEKQGAMKRDVVDTEIASAAAGAPATDTTQIPEGESGTVPGAEPVAVGAEQYSIERTKDMLWKEQLKNPRRNDTFVVEKNTPSYLTERGISDRPLAIPQSVVTKAQSGKDESHSISDKNISKLQSGIESAIAVINDKARNTITFITNLQENGKPIIATFVKDASFDGDTVHQCTSIHARQNIQAYISKFNPEEITVLNQNEFDNLLRNGTHDDASVQESVKLTNDSIPQPEKKVNPKAKENISENETDEKGEISRSEAAEGKAEETGAEGEEKANGAEEGAAEATTEAEAKPEEKADLAKAKRDAERMIAWEKKSAPTTSELNTLREYVKNFDSLPSDRQLAIVRMIRSSKGVDADTVRGVANLMAITNKKGAVLAPDLEFRFAELADGVAQRGIKTEVSGKTVIVLNTNLTYKNTFRGSIAHEIVHYLENRKGYKALADFAMKHAKADKVAEVTKTYTDYYSDEYMSEERKKAPNASFAEIDARVDERLASAEFKAMVDSEVVASVVAEMLNSEKFLKRYAQMGEEQGSVIKRIAKFVKGLANALKDKDKKASAVATDMMNLVDKALGSEVEGEKTGEKVSFDITPDEAREWEKPITIDDVETLRSIGRKSINSFSAEDIKKAQKWAYKFYKELGVKSPFFRAWFGDWRQYERSNFVNILKMEHREGKNPRGQYKNSDTGWVINSSSVGYDETISHSGKDKKSILAMQNIDKIIENAVLLDTEVSEYGRGKKSVYTAFMHKFYALIDIDGEKYIAKMAVDESHAPGQNDTNKKFYHVRAIEIETASSVGIGKSHTPIMEDTVSTVSIADLFEIVKRNDKEFTPNSVNEYMLNEDGTPKVFYHGTEFDFNAFSYEKIGEASGVSILGDGFYFADKKALAKKYGKTVKACYLSMHNPYIATQDDLYGLNSDKLSKQGYDGVILKSPSGNIYMVFDNTQIKSADKAGTEKANIGTFDKSEPDIRYDLDPKTVKKQKKNNEKRSEKLEKENEELKAKLKKERSLREKMARENANAAKAERAKRYTKKEVAPAVEKIESLTDEQVKSLAKGFALEGMSGAQKDRIISNIYIALHEASAEGEAGPGSVAVKGIATRIAWDMVQSAKIKGEDGKYYHLVDIYDEASVQAIANEYADVLYERFANMGEHTKYSYFAAEINAAEEEFRRDRIDDNAIHKLSREVSYQGQRLRRLVETQKRGMEDEGIQKVTKILSSVVDAKGNIIIGKVDAAVGEADRFYSLHSGMIESQGQMQEQDGTALTDFAYSSDANLKFMIDEFKRLRARVDKRGKIRVGKSLDAQEMRLLGKILAGMRKTVTEYNKVFINEKYLDIDKVAEDGATGIVEYHGLEKKAKTKLGELFNSAMRGIKQSYFFNVLTPETTIEAMEGFQIGGVLKTLYHDVRVHKQKAEHLAVQMKKPFAEFLDSKDNVWTDEKGKKHSFRNKLNKKMITVNGADLTLGEAIYLYMLTKRELSHAGLREKGYIVYDENNQRRLEVQIEDVEAVRGQIGAKLDDADKAFLKMAEDFFNKTSTEVKNEADMRIFGYTNIEDGYYVPMIRDRYGRMQGVTDQRQSVGSIVTVYNKSFNQNTVQNARALEGKNIMSIINDHADGLADYSELYIPLKSFDRVYNKAVMVDGKTRSIHEILNDEVWNKADVYLRDLFADIQGQNRKNDNVIDSMVGKLRSAWVNSVLGLNLKVVATQTTSFVAANQVIEAKYLMPAMKKFFGNQSELGARADKYSDIIEPRSFEMGALKAQGNIDKVMEWSAKTGFMINLMDRRVCLAVFHAAELKAEAQGAGAVGTEENARAAAKIADEAIYTTQAMTSASERSALQRSKSEIARTLSMFTSDSVKNLSHFVGNVMKYQAHMKRAKSDLASKSQYEAELKKDAKAIRRSAKTLVMTGVMLGLITQAFKYLYAKEEEEPEDKAKDLITDIISSTFNILPGVSDIIDKFVFNYDMSLNVFDVANDAIEDTASLMNMAGRAMNGEYVSGANVFKNVFNFVKTVGTVFGAPIAPVERTITGLLRRFFPSVMYEYDAMMYNPSYSADLKKAVENGDEALAEHILSTLYKNEATGVYLTPELEEVARLYGLGNTSVIPQKIGTSINDVKLNSQQRRRFESIYSQASEKVNALIRSEYYAELTDGQKARAIKNIYALYYNRAAAEVAGVDWSNAQAYSRLTTNYAALFASQAYKSNLTEYKTPLGKVVTVREQFVDYARNLGLSQNDLLVVLYANGYRDAKTKAAMIAYINSLSISNEEKQKIAERLGFGIKNGKVVEKEKELEVRDQ